MPLYGHVLIWSLNLDLQTRNVSPNSFSLTLNYSLNYKNSVQILAESASKALSLIITKMIKAGGLPYNVYSKLYESCCTSISDYGGEVVGYQVYESTLKVHLKAARAYLGVPINSSIPGVLSEISWMEPIYRNNIRMIRQYSRVLKMSSYRLTKIIMDWDRLLSQSCDIITWTSEIQNIMYDNQLTSVFDSYMVFPVKTVVQKLSDGLKLKQSLSLKLQCQNMSKLRTFIKFKDFSNIPSYILKPLSFPQRRAISKLRLGTFNIRIESGRTERPRLPENERKCNVCSRMFASSSYLNNNILTNYHLPVENEIHYLFFCFGYCDLRFKWLKSLYKPDNFIFLSSDEKLNIVLNYHENVKLTSQFILDAWDRRSKILYE